MTISEIAGKYGIDISTEDFNAARKKLALLARNNNELESAFAERYISQREAFVAALKRLTAHLNDATLPPSELCNNPLLFVPQDDTVFSAEGIDEADALKKALKLIPSYPGLEVISYEITNPVLGFLRKEKKTCTVKCRHVRPDNSAEIDRKAGFILFEKGIYPQAARLLERAAETDGSSELYLALAGCCFHVRENRHKAFRYLQHISDDHCPQANHMLGHCYYLGLGTEINYSAALDCYLRAANDGYTDSMDILASMYEQGLGTEPDLQEALRWCDAAARGGSLTALLNLADSYEKGRGVPQDRQKAHELLSLAAQKGDTDAMYRLAMHYALDKNESLRLLTASAVNNPNAQLQLGLKYKNGDGVPKDEAKAFALFQKSADQGNHAAQFEVGVAYHFALSVKQDYSAALKWYRMSAEGGDTSAMNNLGVLYGMGYGTPYDPVKAAYWYKKSAENGYYLSMRNLAKCHLNGEGVEQNYEKAAYWFQKASDKGDLPSSNQLGLLYEKGLGVTRDYSKAFRLYQMAAEKNVEDSVINLARCYENGLGTQTDPKKSFELYSLEAAKNTAEALLAMGRLYENGFGVEADKQTALEWYEKAQKQNHASAAENITRIKRELGLIQTVGNSVSSVDVDKKTLSLAMDYLSKIKRINDESYKNTKSSSRGQFDVTPPSLSEFFAHIMNTLPAQAIYDLAVLVEKDNPELAIYAYFLAEEAGSLKARYTIVNMAQNHTKYFIDIPDVE